MWNKPIKLFRGVDNTFDILVQDFDQQPYAATACTFRFRAADRNHMVVLTKTLSLRTGFTNKIALDFNRLEIADLEAGLYTWGLSIEDEDGSERPLYLEQNGSSESMMEIAEWSYGDDALVSAVLDIWTLDTNTPVSNDLISAVVSLDVLSGSTLSPMHTIGVFKEAGADGTLSIEVSNDLTNTVWATAYTITLPTGTTSEYANFYGVYERLRFRFTPSQYSTGTVQTLYYRLF